MKVRIEDIIIPEHRAHSRWTDEQKALIKGGVDKWGQLSDPLVRPLEDGTYELIDGESRIKEFKSAGMTEIDVKIVDISDKDKPMANIMMNIARGSQDPMGESLAFIQALEQGHTIEDIVKMTNQSAKWVNVRIALSGLPEEYQNALRSGHLKIGHIDNAFRLPDDNEIAVILDTVLHVGLTVKATKNYVDQRLMEKLAAERLKTDFGIEAPALAPNPTRTMQSTTCLAHNGAVDTNDVTLPRICNDCWNLLRYVTSQVGTGNEAMEKVHSALLLMQASQTRADQIVLQEKLPPIQPQAPAPIPVQQTPDPDFNEAMVKPDNMTAEEWGKLKQTLRTAYSG